MPEVRKNPIFAAVFSFLVWGVGQIYASISNLKIGVGVVLFIGWIFYLALSLIYVQNIFILIGILTILGIIFAFDAYRDARRYNLNIKIEELKRRRSCQKCGTKLEGNPRFCPNCGERLIG
jgi:thiol:disulfide interchange protein